MRRYVVGLWDWIDFDDEVVESRIVFDARDQELVHADFRHGERWIAASREEFNDLEDSLLNGNPDFPESFIGGSMKATSSLPSWAMTPQQKAVSKRSSKSKPACPEFVQLRLPHI
jgi:hypothetical protein